MTDITRAFETKYGFRLENGLFITGGTASPVGLDLPVDTVYARDTANGIVFWHKFNTGVNDWEIYPASKISFDPTGTSLAATDMQAALAELDAQPGGGASIQYMVGFHYRGNVDDKKYLEYLGRPSDRRPFVIPNTITLKEISASIRKTDTITFSIRKNGTEVTTIAISAAKKAVVTGLSISFAANDEVTVRGKTGDGKEPAVNLFFG